MTGWPGGMDTVTDDEGYFLLDRLLPREMAVVVAAEGFEVATSSPVDLEADQRAELVVVLSARADDGWLSVEVEGPTGEPAEGVEVVADGQVQITDSDGWAGFLMPGTEAVDVYVVDPAGRLHPASRTVSVPAIGSERLSFRLSGQPPPDSWITGSAVCAFCHTEISDLHAESAHSGSVSPVDTVPWANPPTAVGLYGGLHRGAVPFDEHGPLPVAWIPADPERGDWLGAEEVSWSVPDPDTAEGDCASCHSTAPNEGVGCEACHGPGGDHVSGPLKEKSFSILNPELLEESDANAVCASCHAAPDFQAWPSGAAAVPGAQSNELADSAHGQCADCHDPHSGDLRWPKEDNTLCLSCHEALDFPDEDAITAHTGHPVYAPAALVASNRCTGCHMPETTARLAWSTDSGAGDLSSHRFEALAPSETLAAFDAAGAGTLEPWAYPANACVACHSWNAWLFEGNFPGPSGDPSKRATHEGYQQAYEGIWP